MGQGIWRQRTLKRPKPPSPWFLLSTLTFRNPKPMRQETNSRARETFSQCLCSSGKGMQKLDIHKCLACADQCHCEATLYYFGKVMVTMDFLRTGRTQSLLFVALEGKKKNLENYRLSSLLLITGKVLKQFQETLSRTLSCP